MESSIVREHVEFRRQIIQLAWLDMMKQYRGAKLSWAWALIRPLVMLVVYWFVLKFGMKLVISKEGIDLFPWLAVGLATWFFILDILNRGTNAFNRYKFLITKMKFPVSVIPTVVTLSNLFVHLGLMAIVMVYLVVVEGMFDVTWLQLPIYMILITIGAIFWSMFASPLTAISKDFHHLVKSVTRIMFWVSGVLWNVQNVEVEWIKQILLANPITGFIEGYRDTLLYHRWFWEDMGRFCMLLAGIAILGILAIVVYKKTRKEVVDVL